MTEASFESDLDKLQIDEDYVQKLCDRLEKEDEDDSVAFSDLRQKFEELREEEKQTFKEVVETDVDLYCITVWAHLNPQRVSPAQLRVLFGKCVMVYFL